MNQQAIVANDRDIKPDRPPRKRQKSMTLAGPSR
jgi:hypothetical protein